MRRHYAWALLAIITLTLLWYFATRYRSPQRSSSIRDSRCCSAYQDSALLPDQPAPNVIRIAVGGDSRDDRAHVLPWAFGESKRRGAKAFIFLGDLEITGIADRFFAPELAGLGTVPFYPVIGNHEVEFFGMFRLPDSSHAISEFKEDFLHGPAITLAPLRQQVVYSSDIEGVIHFIALDNVSRRGEGIGTEQLAWLEKDLESANSKGKIILVGMHKPLAGNPITTHAMDEDGALAIRDSAAALALFKKYGIAMLFVSHSHMYASYNQEGINVRLTGGLGAPLVKGLAEADGGFHHFLLVDVKPNDQRNLVQVEVVRFHGTQIRDKEDESLEIER